MVGGSAPAAAGRVSASTSAMRAGTARITRRMSGFPERGRAAIGRRARKPSTPFPGGKGSRRMVASAGCHRAVRSLWVSGASDSFGVHRTRSAPWTATLACPRTARTPCRTPAKVPRRRPIHACCSSARRPARVGARNITPKVWASTSTSHDCMARPFGSGSAKPSASSCSTVVFHAVQQEAEREEVSLEVAEPTRITGRRRAAIVIDPVRLGQLRIDQSAGPAVREAHRHRPASVVVITPPRSRRRARCARGLMKALWSSVRTSA